MSDHPQSEMPQDATPSRSKRRPRYAGRNPRRFEEKYKEHQSERYAEDAAKIVASGKTLAGTHRPIMVEEILAILAPQPGEIVVDCTLGYGGHTQELLSRILPGGRLIGLDADPIELPKTTARLREAGYGEDQLTTVRSNFAGLPKVLGELGVDGADCILADLGVSSMQLDDPSRGFTFKTDGPLDLRLNPQKPPSATDWLARVSIRELAQTLQQNADEPLAELIADELVARRGITPFTRTRQLADTLREILRGRRSTSDRDEESACIRRVFQALRIAVNDEFGVLDLLLRNLPACLNPGGRVAILTFHSGEDRRVKHAFRDGLRTGVYATTNDEVVRPNSEELRANPRSAPAKLRWAIKVK